MKEGMNRYATKNRLQQKGYFFKYSDGSSGRKAREASRRDSLQQSRQEQKEKVDSLSLDLQELKAKDVEWYGKFVQLTEDVIYTGDQNESIGKENPLETYQEGRQGVSLPDQGRYETEETNTCKTKGKEMKKQTAKERKHEARETKAYEKKEEKKESKSKKK